MATTLESLCVEAIFSSLFQPQFRAHEPGRKIADAASGHCHNSHTWPFGQEEVQLREFVSTLHVQPLSGPGNLAADEPHEHSESCTTPSPTARLLWHLQRALHQAACHATAWVYDDCSGGTLLYGFIFRSTFRASMFITVATKTNSITRHGTE